MAGIQQFLSQNFGHAGTFALVFCSIYGAFVAFDNNLSPHANEYYAKLLNSRKYEILILSLPYGLTTIFKGFFGDRHVSWKCIKRSIFVSYIAGNCSPLITVERG
jgi:hypothetical protein